ncbi:hypothetical protein ACRRTK_010417 [Alexandromys fortis]
MALARRPSPRPATSCPLAGDRACVGVAPLGKVKGLQATSPPGATGFRHRPESDRARRPAGRIVQQETAPAGRWQPGRAELGGPRGGSASPSAPGRPHTCLSVTSARAPGACVSCRS